MRGSRIIGAIIVAILLVGVAYAAVSPILPPTMFPPAEEKKERVITEHKLTSAEIPGVSFVNLNITITAGGLDAKFTTDPNLVYKFIFEQDIGVSEPTVTYIKSGDTLFVNAFSSSGSLNLTLSDRFTYSGTTTIGTGGISMELSERCKVDILDVAVKYAGGILLNIREASFKQLNVKVNTGGIILGVNTPVLEKNASISARVEVGGITVNPLTVGTGLGGRLKGFVEIGGVTFNPSGFNVVKQTVGEVEMTTPNYSQALTRLEIDVSAGLGGLMINQPFFTGFPTTSRV